jgi:hypothetical protein
VSLTDLYGVDIHPVGKPPITCLKQYIISTHHPLHHLTVRSERPIFQAVTTLPLHSVISVLVFIPELDGNLIILKGKEFFTETVVLLFSPFLGQEADDFLGSEDEFLAVTPDAVGRVDFGNFFWISTMTC